jgi:Protein of unknown function (DUF3795)
VIAGAVRPQNRTTIQAVTGIRMTPVKSTMSDPIRTALIAPCGMNCRLCCAYTRDKKACPGCRGDDSVKPKTRVTCRIKNCEEIRQGKARYCFSCDRFPCDRLNHLDERYRTRYGMSMIDNLVHIKKFGIRHFMRNEKERWTCPECSQLLCVHKPQCLFCGHKWR